MAILGSVARSLDHWLTRRALLLGGAGAVAGAIVAPVARASGRLSASASDSPALWRTAFGRGLVYGSSTATWQISDLAYRDLYAREAAILDHLGDVYAVNQQRERALGLYRRALQCEPGVTRDSPRGTR